MSDAASLTAAVQAAVADWLVRAAPRLRDDCHVAKLELTLSCVDSSDEDAPWFSVDLDETFPRRPIDGRLEVKP